MVPASRLAEALSPGSIALDVRPVRQSGESDCGLACLEALLAYWGRDMDDAGRERFSEERLEKEGIAALDVRDYLISRDFRAAVVPGALDSSRPAGLLHVLARGWPVIVQRARSADEPTRLHYAIVTGHEPGRRWVLLMDPARGIGAMDCDEFDALWAAAGRLMIVAAPRAGSDGISPSTPGGS